MTNHDELEKRLSDLESKVSKLEDKIDFAAKVAEIERMVAVNAQSAADDSENRDRQIAIYKDQVDKTERARLELYKIASILIAVGTVLGVIGYASIFRYVRSQTDAKIQPLVEYQYEYATASGLLAARNYSDAIKHFDICFKDKEKQYETALLVPYLNAIDRASDTTKGKEVLDELLGDTKKYDGIEDPLVLNDIGMVANDVGASRPEYLNRAREALDRAEDKVRNGDKENQRNIYTNFWVLNILSGRKEEAEKNVGELLSVNSEDLSEWNDVKNWAPLRTYFLEHPNAEKPAEEMWERLEKARVQNPVRH